MSSRSRGAAAAPGLTDEPPMVFRPYLAKAIGLNESIVVERAHERQLATGQRHRVRHAGGRDLEVVCFWWPAQARYADFPFWDERTVRRLFGALVPRTDDAASSPHVAEPTGAEGHRALLWRFSVRVAGRCSADWYSVNYAAVGDGTLLFPTAAAADQEHADGLTTGADDLSADRGQPDRRPRSTCPPLLGGKGGEDQGPSGPLLQPDPKTPDPSARALDRAGGGQGVRGEAEAVAALVGLGVDAADAADLVARHPDGPRRALVSVDNARRLVAAGFRFDQPARCWAIACMRRPPRALSDADVAGRVEWQRRQQQQGGGGAAPDRDEELRQRILAAGRRL